MNLLTLQDPDLEIVPIDHECFELHFIGIPIGFLAYANQQYIVGSYEEKKITLTRHPTQLETESRLLELMY